MIKNDKLLTEKYFKENTKKFVTEDFFKENTKDFVTKDYIDQNTKNMLEEIRQYNKDLMSGFQDKIYGMGDYVKFIDEKVNKLGNRVSILEEKA